MNYGGLKPLHTFDFLQKLSLFQCKWDGFASPMKCPFVHDGRKVMGLSFRDLNVAVH